ncbi:MAG: peroxiredoxin family protein [Chloroflexota bacterium]|jgi:peroxiredoxin|nr:peroxiredoxin family protein [Chloroflexota bacterium]
MKNLNAVGLPFPDVALPGLDGDDVRFADLRGRRLLLFMWASW